MEYIRANITNKDGGPFPEAQKKLTDLGFDIYSISERRVVIGGDKNLYEVIFQSNIEEIYGQQTIGPVKKDKLKYRFSSFPKIPDSLKEYFDSIYIPQPVDYISPHK